MAVPRSLFRRGLKLTDPRFYAEMSKLLDDLIKQSRADTVTYEAFLQKAEELVQRMAQKNSGAHPTPS